MLTIRIRFVKVKTEEFGEYKLLLKKFKLRKVR